MNERIAEQLAYMLMNRLNLLQDVRKISTLPKLTKIEIEAPKAFLEKRRETFDRVYKDVDCKAIFEPNPVLDKILLPKKLIYTLNDFIEELTTFQKYEAILLVGLMRSLFQISDHLTSFLKRKGVVFTKHSKIEDVIDTVDIIYMTRIQSRFQQLL